MLDVERWVWCESSCGWQEMMVISSLGATTGLQVLISGDKRQERMTCYSFHRRPARAASAIGLAWMVTYTTPWSEFKSGYKVERGYVGELDFL